jgi:drug/metabolite transporter (DMT)-like permease
MTHTNKGALYMVAASLCWSFGGVCIKLIPWGAMSIIGLRALLAAVVFALFNRSIKIELTRGNILSALCLSLTTMLFVFANKMTTAAAAILLQFTAPIFIILIHLIFYKIKPKLKEVVAVSITLMGMLLFFVDRLDGGGWVGNVLAIGSGLCFAGVFVCNKRPDTKPSQALLLGFLINALVGLPFAFFETTADPVAWAAVIFLGVVQVGLAYVFFSKGIQKTPALLACLITALEPVLNPVWVAIATHEVPGMFSILGGVVIVSTVIGYNVLAEKSNLKERG